MVHVNEEIPVMHLHREEKPVSGFVGNIIYW